MPILKNNIGQICVGFGYGDVLIAVCSDGPEAPVNEVVVYSHDGEPQPVGAYNPEEKRKSIGSSDAVRLCFSSIESLNVLIEQCQELRRWMSGERTDQQEGE